MESGIKYAGYLYTYNKVTKMIKRYDSPVIDYKLNTTNEVVLAGCIPYIGAQDVQMMFVVGKVDTKSQDQYVFSESMTSVYNLVYKIKVDGNGKFQSYFEQDHARAYITNDEGFDSTSAITLCSIRLYYKNPVNLDSTPRDIAFISWARSVGGENMVKAMKLQIHNTGGLTMMIPRAWDNGVDASYDVDVKQLSIADITDDSMKIKIAVLEDKVDSISSDTKSKYCSR